MAIKVSNTTVINNSRELENITNLRTINGESILGTGNISTPSGIQYSSKTANYTALPNEGIIADTTSGSFTITLPASPTVGAQVVVADGASFAVNTVTISRNGSTIENLAEDLILDIQGILTQFIYTGTTWQVYSQLGGAGGDAVTLNGTQTLTNKTISGSNNTITNVSLTTGVTGTLPFANGGTNATTPSGARTNLLPSYSSNANKVLAVNTGATDVEWITPASGGSSTLTIDSKTANYTVVAGDLGKIINCTANSFTVSLTAAATLGSGFNVTIWNTGTGVITIDPNASETIDGKTTWVVHQGEGLQIVCTGTTWRTGYMKTLFRFANRINTANLRPSATGVDSLAIGGGTASGENSIALDGLWSSTTASGNGSVAINATASGLRSFASQQGTAGSNYSTAFGTTSAGSGSVTATGAGAMALGGSRAAGTDSFAAAVTSNTSTYGAKGANSVAIGYLANAVGQGSLALGGYFGTASAIGANSVALAGNASGSYSVALGPYSNASGQNTIAMGVNSTASGSNSVAIGKGAGAASDGKMAFSSSVELGGIGGCQTGTIVVSRNTTDSTATVLTTNNTAPGSANQVILPNNSAYAFTGTIVARRKASDGTASAAWIVKGLIRREANAASTVLVNSAVEILDNTPGWAIALTADTTNGGLAVTVTGAASTNIRWVAVVDTAEVTYA